ncbi:NUDIX domain-containing protein [Nocardiopsis sp. NPDC006938]|uniref:NUDIX domain-containing protein n=1 Tax=Nocardiopsis sp. NPDC006938 TaxID=3364337 RepID=UPI0036937755
MEGIVPRIDDFIDADPTLTEALTPEEVSFLRVDARGLTNDADILAMALIDIRAGRWDQRDDTDLGDHTIPGAGQRQLMQNALLAADELLPRAEALRAWALRGLREHHGASHEDIAQMLGVPRSTAQSRWRQVEKKRPEKWDWARGTEHGSDICDTESVGIIVEDSEGRVLVIDRTTAPWGAACPSGHPEGHGSRHGSTPGVPDQPIHRAAAVGELSEEVGLHVAEEDLELAAHGWRDNRCRRELRPGAPAGHWWTIYHVRTWRGEVRVDPDEVTNARWCTRDQLQELVEITIDHAHGRITETEFRARGGAEPVWVRWWRDAGLVRAASTDLDAVEKLASTPPSLAA